MCPLAKTYFYLKYMDSQSEVNTHDEILFSYLKVTGKKWTGKMVENATGVKNWCQFIFVNRNAKKAS